MWLVLLVMLRGMIWWMMEMDAAIEARGSLTEVKLMLKGSLVVWLVLSLLFG